MSFSELLSKVGIRIAQPEEETPPHPDEIMNQRLLHPDQNNTARHRTEAFPPTTEEERRRAVSNQRQIAAERERGRRYTGH